MIDGVSTHPFYVVRFYHWAEEFSLGNCLNSLSSSFVYLFYHVWISLQDGLENDLCENAISYPPDGSVTPGTVVGATFNDIGVCGSLVSQSESPSVSPQ